MPKPKAKPPLPSEVFVTELKRTRERRQFTQQQLADRLDELDSPVDRSAIGKIESGTRGVSLDELFAFAVALGVSPTSLVLPRSENEISVAPNRDASVADAIQWIRGTRILEGEETTESDRRYFYEESRSDGEAAAFRRHPNLRTIVEIVAGMVSAATAEATDDASFARTRLVPPEVSYVRLLVNLGFWAQREWNDLGGEGHVGRGATPAARQAATEEITRLLLEQFNRSTEEDTDNA